MDVTRGTRWKSLRKNITPLFSSGKLKRFVEPMNEVIEDFLKHIDRACDKEKPIEVKALLQGKKIFFFS